MSITVAELLALAKEGRQVTAEGAWLKPDPVYPTTEKRVTQDSHAGHTALDLAAPLDSPILAVYEGVVERVIPNEKSGYGNLVIVRQPDGTRAYYGHLNAFGVREGQTIKRGQPIGLAGSTGNSSGSHLHLEFRTPSGTQIDPHKYFETNYQFSDFRGPGGRSEYGASEMIGRELPKGSVINAITGLGQPGGSILRALPGAAMPGTAGSTFYPAGTKVAAGTIGNGRDPGGIKILETPIGDISIAELPWLNIAAVGLGAILVLVAVGALLQPAYSKISKQAIPLVAGAVNPAAGAVASAIS